IREAHAYFDLTSDLGYAARYEYLRLLWDTGQRPEARTQFQALFLEALNAGLLPRIDHMFVEALQDGGKDPSGWSRLIRQAAGALTAKGNRGAVLALAWQCHQLEDAELAGEVFDLAIREASGWELQALRVAALPYLWHTGQYAQADGFVQVLLGDGPL